MKKITIILAIVAVIIVAACIVIIVINNSNNNKPNEYSHVVIIQRDPTNYDVTTGQNKIIKTVTIDSSIDLDEINKYARSVKPLSGNEMVKLALLDEIEIKLNDSKSIKIQLSEKSYCSISDSSNNSYDLSHMPSGLYDWVVKMLNK